MPNDMPDPLLDPTAYEDEIAKDYAERRNNEPAPGGTFPDLFPTPPGAGTSNMGDWIDHPSYSPKCMPCPACGVVTDIRGVCKNGDPMDVDLCKLAGSVVVFSCLNLDELIECCDGVNRKVRDLVNAGEVGTARLLLSRLVRAAYRRGKEESQ